MLEIKKECRICGRQKIFIVTNDQAGKLLQGELVQNVLRDMSIDDRELYISNVCGICFDKMFGQKE